MNLDHETKGSKSGGMIHEKQEIGRIINADGSVCLLGTRTPSSA